MTTSAMLLVVLAALIHASWNLLAKKAAPAGAVFVAAYSLFAAMIYAPWVAYLFIHQEVNWSWIGVGVLFVSAIIHLGYNLCLQRGYQVADLSVVYPVARGTGPLLSSIGAFLLLGEMPSVTGVLGLLLVVLGILLIATQGRLDAFSRPEGHAGVRWGTATGGLIASYTVVDAYAVKTLGIAPVIMDWTSNLLRVFMLMPLLLRNPQRARAAMQGYWGIAFAVGLLSPLSYILVLTALTQGAPVSLVAPMREMSMMLGTFMGMIFLREKVGFWRFVGCAILILGVIFLSKA